MEESTMKAFTESKLHSIWNTVCLSPVPCPLYTIPLEVDLRVLTRLGIHFLRIKALTSHTWSGYSTCWRKQTMNSRKFCLFRILILNKQTHGTMQSMSVIFLVVLLLVGYLSLTHPE